MTLKKQWSCSSNKTQCGGKSKAWTHVSNGLAPPDKHERAQNEGVQCMVATGLSLCLNWFHTGSFLFLLFVVFSDLIVLVLNLCLHCYCCYSNLVTLAGFLCVLPFMVGSHGCNEIFHLWRLFGNGGNNQCMLSDCAWRFTEWNEGCVLC